MIDADAYHSGMAIPRIRKGARGHLYIAEHMDAKGLSDERLAGRIGVDRVTVTSLAQPATPAKPR